MTISQILDRLRETYCDTIGVEYRHIQEPAERTFFEERLERDQPERSASQQKRTLLYLERAETFVRFLAQRYVGEKRFGLEGGESTIPFLDSLFERAAVDGTTEVIMGMAHRGRLNTLVNIVGRPLAGDLRVSSEGTLPIRLTVEGAGDVKYHKGGEGIWTGLSGRTLQATLASNPSHLETVDPVVEGIARARQDLIGVDGASQRPLLPVLIHGDALDGRTGYQVAETLNLSLIPAYRTGGTVHLIINNQIGFTDLRPNGSVRPGLRVGRREDRSRRRSSTSTATTRTPSHGARSLRSPYRIGRRSGRMSSSTSSATASSAITKATTRPTPSPSCIRRSRPTTPRGRSTPCAGDRVGRAPTSGQAG